MSSNYKQALSELIDIKQLLVQFGFFNSSLTNIFNGLYVTNYSSSRRTQSLITTHQLVVSANDKIGFKLPSSELELILNPSFVSGTVESEICLWLVFSAASPNIYGKPNIKAKSLSNIMFPKF